MDLPTDGCQLTEGIDKNEGVVLYHTSHYLFIQVRREKKKNKQTKNPNQIIKKKKNTTQPQLLTKIIFHRSILPLTDVTALPSPILCPAARFSVQAPQSQIQVLHVTSIHRGQIIQEFRIWINTLVSGESMLSPVWDKPVWLLIFSWGKA